MKKFNIKSIISIIISIICIFGIIYSSYKIINWKIDVDKNKRIKEEQTNKIKKKKVKNEEVKYEIDFKSLKEQNKDTIAYLKVNNTNIDYIVVKGKDNDYYLNHNFNKEYNIAGWIFGDYRNIFDGSDRNLVIYGHDTRDGSMFGTLKRVLNKEWYENKDNHIVLLITENKTYYYEVFSTYTIEPESYYINTYFSSDNEFNTFINKIKERSIYNYNVDVTKDDRVLTLSSCIQDGKKRVVLHAKLIKEE